ncbi:MAG: hypothetical protein OXU66_03760 [Gammaproteobacteria bacterium]|nr:hypothetical protein [Gammaproteobacteria bacterium]MDD9896617.1 hypothetical protein [Gammaproteobacteria bacterium]MDD9958035.1 hypothetical protein [Gammaproteobacteria bacterium]
MNIWLKQTQRILGIGAAILLLVMSKAALAQGNSQAKGNGKNKNVGVGNASDGISARIITDRGIFYTGDPLSISLRFNRGAELVSGGEVDAYLVIFSPVLDESGDDGDSNSDSDIVEETDSIAADTEAAVNALSDAVVLPVSDQASSDEQKLFEVEAVDVAALPAGTYQLGLILTNPGGDPLVINDWFKGLLGLIDIVGLTVSDEALPFDEDMDGQVDDDTDEDGFSDDDSEEEEEEEEEESEDDS